MISIIIPLHGYSLFGNGKPEKYFSFKKNKRNLMAVYVEKFENVFFEF